jgi:uncharacterized SAM-binding protein YcdF (DUF218 family)
MNWVSLCRLLGLGGAALFLAGALTPLPQLLDRWLGAPAEIEPSDAIVVLASSISREGVLSPASAIRAFHGIALYRRGLAPLLAFSGRAAEGGPTEAEARAEIARARGVPPGAILMETEARTTREEALRQRALLRPKGVRTILLVTDSLHIRRARPLFERAGFQVRPAPPDSLSDPDTPEDRLGVMRGVLEELLALLYYRLAGFI